MVNVPNDDENEEHDTDRERRVALLTQRKFVLADADDIGGNVGELRRNSPPGFAAAVDEVEETLAGGLNVDDVVIFGYWVETVPVRPVRPSAARRVELAWHDSARYQCRVEGVDVVIDGQPTVHLVWRSPHAWGFLGAAQHYLSGLSAFVESGVFDPDEDVLATMRDLFETAALTVNAAMACGILSDAYDDEPDVTVKELLDRQLDADDEDVVGDAGRVKDLVAESVRASPRVFFPGAIADAISNMVARGMSPETLDQVVENFDAEEEDDDE